jgi:hypothetical protein
MKTAIVFREVHFSRTVCLLLCAISIGAAKLWGRQGDQNNGHYRNPILFSDYSDPDVIRVGKSYFLVASSFHFMPGIPVLESHDLVNWHIITHVFPRLNIDRKYDMDGGDRYAQGAWAPSIRFHDGRFYVFFPTPREGIFMSSAASARGHGRLQLPYWLGLDMKIHVLYGTMTEMLILFIHV